MADTALLQERKLFLLFLPRDGITLFYRRNNYILEVYIMKYNTLERLVNAGCVCTGSCNCDYCPYVIYASDTGTRLCEKETYDECCESTK